MIVKWSEKETQGNTNVIHPLHQICLLDSYTFANLLDEACIISGYEDAPLVTSCHINRLAGTEAPPPNAVRISLLVQSALDGYRVAILAYGFGATGLMW